MNQKLSYQYFFKPFWEMGLAFFLLLLLMPLIVIVYVLGWIYLRENPIFIQSRAGYRGKSFFLIKFKTLKSKTHFEQTDESRMNGWGKWLRQYNFDEVLQLLLIFTGKMALIGPRPLYEHYNTLYSESQKKRLNVKPGITGWAQVNGKNTLSWDEKFKLDVYYAENLNFSFDMHILYKTIFVIFSKNDVIFEKPFSGQM